MMTTVNYELLKCIQDSQIVKLLFSLSHSWTVSPLLETHHNIYVYFLSHPAALHLHDEFINERLVCVFEVAFGGVQRLQQLPTEQTGANTFATSIYLPHIL